MPFSTRLRELRKSQKLTQDELGEKIGVHGRHVGKYENGQVMPNADTVIKIARVLNVSLDYLLLDSDNPRLDDIRDVDLLRYFKELSGMEDTDREIVKSLIDAYLTKKKLEKVLSKV